MANRFEMVGSVKKKKKKKAFRNKPETRRIFLVFNVHVHSWHGTAHGVGRRPHTSIILSDAVI